MSGVSYTPAEWSMIVADNERRRKAKQAERDERERLRLAAQAEYKSKRLTVGQLLERLSGLDPQKFVVLRSNCYSCDTEAMVSPRDDNARSVVDLRDEVLVSCE